METLIQLLERKNLCLRNFKDVSEKYLRELITGSTEGLEAFTDHRRRLLKAIETLDSGIAIALAPYPTADALPPSDRQKVSTLDQQRRALAAEILSLDQEIMVLIEKIKSETIYKLHQLSSGRRVLGSYRSRTEEIEAAEGNRLLDNEA